MADPLSVAAIAGLVYAGRKLSQPKETYAMISEQPVDVQMQPTQSIEAVKERPIENLRPVKTSVDNLGVVAPQFRTSGAEVLEMRNRMNDYNRMNNVSPVEKRLVGPGLGIDPSVPSYGGYQQLLRVNPENVGAYRLTTLPGRSGPAHDVSGGRRGVVGAVAHNRPLTCRSVFQPHSDAHKACLVVLQEVNMNGQSELPTALKLVSEQTHLTLLQRRDSFPRVRCPKIQPETRRMETWNNTNT